MRHMLVIWGVLETGWEREAQATKVVADSFRVPVPLVASVVLSEGDIVTLPLEASSGR